MPLSQRSPVPSRTDASPLGFFTFAIGTISVACVLGGIEPIPSIVGAIPVFVIVSAFATLVAGLFGFARGETLRATAFCVYGSVNGAIGAFYWLLAHGAIAGTLPQVTEFGVGLFGAAYVSLAIAAAAIHKSAPCAAMSGSLAAAYALLAVGAVANSPQAGHVGGYLLFVAALCALYGGTAALFEDVSQR